MKKILFICLMPLFLMIGIYLNRSYAYFYSFLGQNNLAAPASETEMMLGNQSASQTIKYIALGDSLTTGVGVSDYKNSYPYLIAQKLSLKKNVELINLAQVGATSSEVIATQLPKAISQKPDLITLLIGINDIHNLKSLKEFRENLIQIVSSLKRSDAKIYVLSIPYLGSNKIVFFPYNVMLNLRTRQFNKVIKKVSTDYQVRYIDLYSLKKFADFYSKDQFHPSASGYKIWSEAINVN